MTQGFEREIVNDGCGWRTGYKMKRIHYVNNIASGPSRLSGACLSELVI